MIGPTSTSLRSSRGSLGYRLCRSPLVSARSRSTDGLCICLCTHVYTTWTLLQWLRKMPLKHLLK